MMKISHIYISNNFLSIFDVEALIRYGGLLFVFLVVYGTIGLFFCFFILVVSIPLIIWTGKELRKMRKANKVKR